MIDFAKRNDILSVYVGTDPEENRVVYWLLVPGKFDERLEEKISQLELDLCSPRRNITIRSFPISPEKAGEYGFIGKEIYRANYPKQALINPTKRG